MVETWKRIPNFEKFYEVSNFGNVRSINREVKNSRKTRWIKGKTLKKKIINGYEYVILSVFGKYYSKIVHRLVAEAFIPNPDNLPQVNHKDENKLNNKVDNLEWCTAKYNINYGTAKKRSIEKRQKKIVQYTLQNKIVKKWNNAYEIEREVGYDKETIRECCRNEIKTAYGFKWKYEN